MEGRAEPENVRRLVDAIMSLGADLELPVVLRRLTEAAVSMVDATYGALGVLSQDRSHLSAFITVGIDDEESARIGELPKGHGILGLLIVRPEPLRLPDLTQHPESFGFPEGHPTMTSFLGVPVMVRGEVFGNLYLTDKRGGPFTSTDEELAIGLAAAAGVAIENTRLLARTRELDIAHERERIARDLHDTVIQRLFATGLSLQSAARLSDRPDVVERIQAAVDELDTTVRDVRSSIFELNPPPSSSRGLRRQLLAVGDEFFDALGYSPTFRFEGPRRQRRPGLHRHPRGGGGARRPGQRGQARQLPHRRGPRGRRPRRGGGLLEDAGRGLGERRADGRGWGTWKRGPWSWAGPSS